MTIPISIVIPCYNEEKRLEPGLTRALDGLTALLGPGFEVVFVDDGSTDGTKRILDDVRARRGHLLVEVIAYSPNAGKGWAVRTGMLAARGEKVITMDADFSIDIAETARFAAALDEADVVIGTKKHELTQSIKHQGPLRKFLGKGFTVLTNLLLGLRFTDITCGMKGFRREAAQSLFSRQRLRRWSYDSEILFLARRLGLRSVEIPVRWTHIEGSKVSEFRDVVQSFRDLLAILINAYTGKYKG